MSCFRRVEKLRPELIVITGDYMTGRGTSEIDHVGRVLAQMKPAPLGVIGTLGNHDYGSSWRDTRVADQLVPVLRDAGVTFCATGALTWPGCN